MSKVNQKKWVHEGDILKSIDGREIVHIFKISKSEWVDDMKSWPNVTYKDILNYLVFTEGIDGEDIENWRSMDSWRYFDGEKVNTIFAYKPTQDLIYLKAEVTPSQSVNNAKHTAWVLVRDTGIIESAGCTCIAGMGKSCSHAGAILWKLEFAAKEGWCGKTCTDVQQRWNRGTCKNVEPKKMQDIAFTKKRKRGLMEEGPVVQVSMKELPSCTTKAELEVVADTSTVKKLFQFGMLGKALAVKPQPVLVRQALHSEHFEDKLTCLVCEHFYRNYVNASHQQRTELQNLSAGQSQSEVWRDMRRCRITASSAKKVPVRADPANFLREHLYPSFKGNSNTRHGLVSEPKALDKLRADTGANITCHGSFISSEEPWLAASPDGLMGDVVVEVKCPVLSEEETFEERLTKGMCDLHVQDGQTVLKINGPMGYYKQVQLTMFCTGKRSCKFFVWTNKGEKCVDVLYDNSFVTKEVLRLRKFYFLHMLPRLATDFSENRLQFGNLYKRIITQ